MQATMVDVDEGDAQEVTYAIEKGCAFDEQILKAISNYPVYFHASMVQDLRCEDTQQDEQEKKLEVAEGMVWQARLTQLKEQVAADVQLTQRAAHGHKVLQDRYLRHN